ncbi:MAG: transcription elongation factor GreA [Candidatus Liptonbacteria bacterium]|nr:transcription elongation factor GreA [Candidatus Liptonbacteria bacterium]
MQKPGSLQKQDDCPIYLTADGLRRLKDKLAHLKSSLPTLITETARTAAYGDRSENAEYKEAKSQLRRTHNQIWSIEARLKRVHIIDERHNTPGIVGLGSTVVLATSGSTNSSQAGKQITFQILGPHETNPEKGAISHLSPLGKALLHRKRGDTVSVATENGLRIYKVLEIL